MPAVNRASCYPPVFVFHAIFPYSLVPLVQDSPNPKGIMSSKASGEPCLMLSTGILTGLQNAVAAARAEFGGDCSGAGGAEKVCRHARPTLSIQMSCRLDCIAECWQDVQYPAAAAVASASRAACGWPADVCMPQ